MIKVVLQGKEEKLSINAMIDSGATEDFIDKEVCQKHQISTIAIENPREIYLADGNPSDMGHVTHIAKVSHDNWKPPGGSYTTGGKFTEP